jgi:hypothetical protein
MVMPKPKNDQSFIELYEKALKEGERRFGSACDHTETKDGVCLKCLRKVITKEDMYS